MENYIYVVYATDGYICGEPRAAFMTIEAAEAYASENVLSGIKRVEIKTHEIKNTNYDCYC